MTTSTNELEIQMKRKNYKVTFFTQAKNGANWVGEFTRHAWNSANREIESHMRLIAKEDGCNYSLTSKESVKLSGEFGFFCGTRVWTGENGSVITFEIQRLDQ